jgi:hypothetical protein
MKRAGSRELEFVSECDKQARARELLTRLSHAMAAVIEETARCGAKVPPSVRAKVDDMAMVCAEIQQMNGGKR